MEVTMIAKTKQNAMREQEKSITLLGNQGTKYPQDYAPEVLETFVNKRSFMITLTQSSWKSP